MLSQHMLSMRNKKKYHQILPLIWSFAYRKSQKLFSLLKWPSKPKLFPFTLNIERKNIQGPVVQNIMVSLMKRLVKISVSLTVHTKSVRVIFFTENLFHGKKESDFAYDTFEN